jgi:anaphase-promoting complex subunit 6
MFLGMQETALGNLTIAREYLTAAYDLCDRDPALLNEIGVVAYMEEDHDAACRHFELALSIASQNETPSSQTTATRLNLAHAHRRAGRLQEALIEFEEVIRLGLREAGVFAAKGLVLLELEQAFEATVAFHEALAISPQDPIAGELLAKALLALEGQSVMGAQDEESVNAGLMNRVREIKQANASGLGRKSRRRRVIHEDPSVLADGMDLDGAAG